MSILMKALAEPLELMRVDERPAFSRLKEDIINAPEGARPFDVVTVYKIDRFARKLKILLDIVDFFNEHEIGFISATESIDTSTPFGKAMFAFLGVIAELEVETIKQRTAAGREEAIKKGIYMGAAPPFGFMRGEDGRLIILKAEAKVVIKIFDLFVNEKRTLYEIAKLLKEINEPSPEEAALIHKKKAGMSKKKNSIDFWRENTVRGILQNDIYIGVYYYNKHKNGKALLKSEWKISPYSAPILIDLVTFEKAQSLMLQNKHIRTRPEGSHIYLLTGITHLENIA